MQDAQEQALVKISVARQALAYAKNLPDVKRIHDQASAIEHYMKRQQYSADAIGDASELKLRAERRLGELLADTVKPGNPKLSKRPTIGRIPEGISRDQSHRWQLVAAVPEPKFEEHIATVRDKQEHLTTSGIVSLAKRQDRVEKIIDISRGNAELSTAVTYPVIYADPPWRYEHVKTESRAIENQYPTMTLDDICALPVGDLATPDALLFLWATSPKLAEAMRVVDAWRFTYRTSMVWVKEQIGMGYYARQRHELLLIATKGTPPVPEPENRPDSVVTAPRVEHSAKPPVFYEHIERMYPEFPKIELFCRQPREGWAAWGNQAVPA